MLPTPSIFISFPKNKENLTLDLECRCYYSIYIEVCEIANYVAIVTVVNLPPGAA